MENSVNKRLPYLTILCIAFMSSSLPGSPPGQGASRLTPDQVEKVHSHLFPKGPVGEIPNTLSRTKGDVHIPCVVGVVQRVKVDMSFADELGMLASGSDLVVLGKAGTGTSHMNADKDFLYTDWNFIVEEVFKNNLNSAVQSGATIVVTRPGGKLQVNGRMVYATCADFLDFESGQEYLLYLHFVSETGAYSIAGGGGAFIVSPTSRRLDSVNYQESIDKDTLLKSAREGVAISAKYHRGSAGSQ